MSEARLVAQLLSKRFMAEGKVVGASNSVGTREDGAMLAAASGKQDAWAMTDSFTKLAVLSVGYRDGKHDLDEDEKAKPEVVVFAAGRPTKTFLDSLPKFIGSVRITVLKTASAGINPEQADEDTDEPRSYRKDGRIACGSSIATATGSAGTLGALVKKDGQDDLFLLSCNHVIAACNQINLGMPILAPAPNDSKPFGVLPVPIARLDEMVPLRYGVPGSTPPCEEDVALGRVLSPDLVTSWQGGDNGYDTPLGVAELEDGMDVKKYGRSSGLTSGKVYAIVPDFYPILCQSPAHEFKATAWFMNFAHIISASGPFALPGDSGSLVVTEDGKSAVGILFSVYGKGELAQIIPIRRALEVLGVALLNGHGT